ncbi:MAG: hypothetical protein LBG92_05900 [Prevotellaceae bacterium]|jgi:hypothetical protein|nr:hypothetical protein [Prevotellaceae bacterium]
MLRNRIIKRLTSVSAKRKVTAHNFDTANTMCVIMTCYSHTVGTTAALEKIAKKHNIKITEIVYFPEDEPMKKTRSKSKIVFSDENCSWLGKPELPELQNCINTDFSILIDLSLTTWFPLKYVLLASKACFKVGYNSENAGLYDFLLLGKNDTEENLIKNTETYLQKLKRNE